MRPPSILDVVRAVREVVPAHPEVRAWWYAPSRGLPPQGRRAGERADAAVEVIIETDTASVDLARIGSDLADRLRRGPVSVRRHRGNGEERQLYRLMSRRSPAAILEWPPGRPGARGGG
jgi:hypothetical protein